MSIYIHKFMQGFNSVAYIYILICNIQGSKLVLVHQSETSNFGNGLVDIVLQLIGLIGARLKTDKHIPVHDIKLLFQHEQ